MENRRASGVPGTDRQQRRSAAASESWQPPAAQSRGFAPQTLQGQLLLSGKPPLNLARYIRELKAYPYGCLEQTASGLFPSLYTSAAQLKALGISGDSDENAARPSMSVFHACCRCSWKTAALRYGIERAGRVLADRLRHGLPRARQRAGL